MQLRTATRFINIVLFLSVFYSLFVYSAPSNSSASNSTSNHTIPTATISKPASAVVVTAPPVVPVSSLTQRFVPSTVSATLQSHITNNFKKSLPTLNIDTVQTTPINNLYQITSGPVVMYVTLDGDYAISGDILDLRDGKTNLTESARRQALTKALQELGDSNMISYAPPADVKPQYTIHVFTDPECSYCKKFHANMSKMNALGITVRYLAFPRSGKNTPSYNTLVSVWCAPNRKEALNQAMLGPISITKCSTHPVDKEFRLGALAGVSGTPTMVINGQLIAGYYPPEELLELLKSMPAH